ncbi:MAG: hypothetical protein LUD16_05340 [Lachnospiraceae bacterium]|nr:hypothetical protein [Lachnospiraceae bacterium]
MSEYRRFVAYFYEYIDGKKQGNAGFAKVELRNGMWRILFRLTLPDMPEPPMRVYGFVRERGYLPEIPLGTMSEDNFGPEEWAWRADAPIGSGKYYFEQMTGIRIQSGDGRVFLTVWDDAPVEMDQFVSEIPEQMTEAKTRQRLSEKPLEELREPKSEMSVQRSLEQPEVEMSAQSSSELPEMKRLVQKTLKQPEVKLSVQNLPESPESAISEQESPEMSGGIPIRLPKEIPPEKLYGMRLRAETSEEAASMQAENPAEVLLRRRQPFRPFGDEEFFDCVQIKLCDLLPLQQEGWQVGRSNFLQHGYYLYRHLLLGRAEDGCYVVGVPGLRSQQEEYVAHTFGYDRFKLSGLRGCGRTFGYWCRVLDDSGIVKKE